MTWMLRLAAIILAAAMVLMGQAVEQPTEELEFASIQDTAAPEEPETTQEDEPEPIWGVVYEEEETYYGEPYYEPYSGSDGFMQEGVREGVPPGQTQPRGPGTRRTRRTTTAQASGKWTTRATTVTQTATTSSRPTTTSKAPWSPRAKARRRSTTKAPTAETSTSMLGGDKR